MDQWVGLKACFQGCWRDAEAEVLQSLQDCQRRVSALLADVHQQRCSHPFPCPSPQAPPPLTPVSACRLALLQTFENNVTSQLKHLQQTSAGLSSMDADILVLAQLLGAGLGPGPAPGCWTTSAAHAPLGLSSRAGFAGRGSVSAPSVKTTSRGQSGPGHTGVRPACGPVSDRSWFCPQAEISGQQRVDFPPSTRPTRGRRLG